MAFNFLPPSPAPSDCDSLAGIDDLEAFLAAKGPLSYFPTPDLRQKLVSASQQCHTPDQWSPSNQDEGHEDWLLLCPDAESGSCAAETFIRKTGECIASNRQTTFNVAELLESANLPIELLALAYAVLDALSKTDTRMDCEEDILLVAAMALADIHINDRPYHLRVWTRLITSRTVELHCLDRMILVILESLDWSIHQLCDPALIAMHVLTISQPYKPRQSLPQLRTRSSSTALWRAGQLTPAEHSPSPVAKSKPTYFLPLL